MFFSGGTAVNVLAPEAKVAWEYRALPDQNPEAIMARAAKAADAIGQRYKAGAPNARFDTKIKAALSGIETRSRFTGRKARLRAFRQ
jgi:metal-dependent amidase/aminoacylase/carboxypeptidase family protein